jgi:hypothetical protein
MKFFFTKKQLESERAALNYAKSEYEYYAAKWDYIQSLFNTDFREMSVDEIKEFFKYNPDVRHYDFCRGMEAGIDIIIDTFEKSGVAKKHTLEKLRRRAKQQIKDHTNEVDDD